MQQVADWLAKLGLGQYAPRFAEAAPAAGQGLMSAQRPSLQGDLLSPAAENLKVMCSQRACGCTGLATMLCQYGHARPLSPDRRRAAM